MTGATFRFYKRHKFIIGIIVFTNGDAGINSYLLNTIPQLTKDSSLQDIYESFRHHEININFLELLYNKQSKTKGIDVWAFTENMKSSTIWKKLQIPYGEYDYKIELGRSNKIKINYKDTTEYFTMENLWKVDRWIQDVNDEYDCDCKDKTI
jgi:hypothetical protein